MLPMLLGGVVAVVAVGAAAIGLRDANYRIERSVRISSDKTKIFEILKDFRQFEHWSPWEKLDPKMQKSFEGETGAVGSYYHWAGNKQVGEGTMTVLETQKDEGVDLRLEFFRPFASQALVRWAISDTGDGTQTVSWSMKGKHPNLMAKAFAPMMTKMLTQNFDEGLAKLKAYCEKG